MSARITPLRLEGFEHLPKHARRCVFWEVDPATLQEDHLSDPEFEKEAWLSMVMLEWGSCGQVAVQCSSAETDDPDLLVSNREEPCLGYAFYAPPRAVPRAGLFPSGPVSADAILLTSVGVEAGPDSESLPQRLLTSVVADLVRRGVRALEAFGRTEATEHLADPRVVPGDCDAAVAVLGDCSVQRCVIGADLLEAVGFTVVAPHPYFPRLRLELEQGLGWKADVEAALERLLESAQLQQPVGAGAGRYT
ncbi:MULTISPECIES: acetyltransferase [Mycobacteriaceae]|uniref:acetyltransferase n=1 Tax=Mycobacteriaceae TaxID=1762 RepID=UPI00080178DE|nr:MULTISPECIES: acetyltransferase [Mycobacteriaceae]MCK0175983.1 acetyltransferase [Mycolicibacterium sp. F2034L]OBB58581.1 acetyltransferase [Mycobacterium sp. 852013-51886_SCH5428379]